MKTGELTIYRQQRVEYIYIYTLLSYVLKKNLALCISYDTTVTHYSDVHIKKGMHLYTKISNFLQNGLLSTLVLN